VMATLVISISSDISVKSVGSSFPRVIIIGSISVEVPIAQEVGAAVVASPTRVLELDTHSSLEDDLSESSPPPVSVALMVLPFMCSDYSESYTKIPKRHIPIALILPAPSAIVAPSSEFPLASIVAHPGFVDDELFFSDSGRTFPLVHITLLGSFYFGSSSRHSSSDRLSSGNSILGHSLLGHATPDTIDADSSTPSRFVHPSLARTLLCSEAYLYWRSAPLSTMYPPTTSKSSAGDSFSESSTRPSRKRCRSHAAIMISSIYATRALVPSHADLLPPRKRFRDSISTEDSVKEDIDTDVLEDIEADDTAVEVAVDRDVEARIDACIGMEVDVRVGVEDEVEDEVESRDRGTMKVGLDVVLGINILNDMLIPDVMERLEQIDEGLRDIYNHIIEIPLQRIEDIKTGQRELEARSMIVGGERANLLDQNMTITRSGMTPEAIKELVNRRVDGDNGNGGNGNGGDSNENGGNGNPNENNRDARPVA
nr:hypothetical protein [Tanacetum cinerariifolium]